MAQPFDRACPERLLTASVDDASGAVPVETTKVVDSGFERFYRTSRDEVAAALGLATGSVERVQ